MDNSDLILLAKKAMNNSYSPYSNYKVGAALLCDNGNVYTGCNIENASFSVTNCAECTAFYKAISEGENSFRKIAIIGKNSDDKFDTAFPCGICRQVMAEFCDEDFIVIVAKSASEYKEYNLSELLPFSFTSKNLGG